MLYVTYLEMQENIWIKKYINLKCKDYIYNWILFSFYALIFIVIKFAACSHIWKGYDSIYLALREIKLWGGVGWRGGGEVAEDGIGGAD